MRKHVVFLVHGMGVNVGPDGLVERRWADSAAGTLEREYSKYRILAGVPFAERFEIVTLNYDTVFNNLLQRWAEEGLKLRATGVPITGIVGAVFEWLDSGAAHDDNFAWTHVADVVLYRYFSLARQHVKTRVAKQIHAALKPNRDGGAVTTWSVIAHSLGTAVIHDTLHAMHATTPEETGIPILGAMVPSANVVAMIANVSQILESDVPVYESGVVPPTSIKPHTACFSYLSAGNRYDPFLVPGRFDPKGEPDWKEAKSNGSFLPIRVDNVNELNVHSFDNYLRNPQLHIPLFEQLAGRGSVSQKEKEKAINDFDKWPSQTILDEAKKIKRESNRGAPQWPDVIGRAVARLRSSR